LFSLGAQEKWPSGIWCWAAWPVSVDQPLLLRTDRSFYPHPPVGPRLFSLEPPRALLRLASGRRMVQHTGRIQAAMERIHAVSVDESVERLSVKAAAEALGVTRDAIHKRIHRGTIEYEKGEDGRFYVHVDTSTKGLDSSTDASKDKSKVESEALISELRAHNETLRKQLEAERQAHAEARRLLLNALQKIPPAIEALGGPERAAEEMMEATPSEPSRGPETPSERPWWRFW
jgi:hypothetical protein